MPADRLTLYYSGTDPAGNRRGNAQAASVGCNSQYNCDLVRNEGCQFGLAPGRTGKVVADPALHRCRDVRPAAVGSEAVHHDPCTLGFDHACHLCLNRRLCAHVQYTCLDPGLSGQGKGGQQQSVNLFGGGHLPRFRLWGPRSAKPSFTQRFGQQCAADDSGDEQSHGKPSPDRQAPPGKIRILYTISSIRARWESKGWEAHLWQRDGC